MGRGDDLVRLAGHSGSMEGMSCSRSTAVAYSYTGWPSITPVMRMADLIRGNSEKMPRCGEFRIDASEQ